MEESVGSSLAFLTAQRFLAQGLISEARFSGSLLGNLSAPMSCTLEGLFNQECKLVFMYSHLLEGPRGLTGHWTVG